MTCIKNTNLFCTLLKRAVCPLLASECPLANLPCFGNKSKPKPDFGNNVENRTLRPFAMAAGAMADVGLTLFKPITGIYNVLKAPAMASKAAKPIKTAGNFVEHSIDAASKTKNAGRNILTKIEQAALGAADGMLASGDMSLGSAGAGAFFGGTLGTNSANNAINSERELIKFARAPSYQQRWAKEYLKRKYQIDAKESPRAIRELIRKEAKSGENIDSVINRNNARLDELNSHMDDLLKTQRMGNMPVGMKFRDFANDIKENVYIQGREIGSSEGKKLEDAIGEIIDDIRITQLEKKAQRGELTTVQMSPRSAREFVEGNRDELMEGIPLTLNDVNELKRAMQKRTSMYKRSSAAQARAGTETAANAAGAKSINRQLDLLSDIPDDIMGQGKALRETLGDINFETFNGAINLKALDLEQAQRELLEKYLKGDALKKYRAINAERSDLIGKNDIFETMLAKFEFRNPTENFIPNKFPSAVNPVINVPQSEASRAASRVNAKVNERLNPSTRNQPADSLSVMPTSINP